MSSVSIIPFPKARGPGSAAPHPGALPAGRGRLLLRNLIGDVWLNRLCEPPSLAAAGDQVLEGLGELAVTVEFVLAEKAAGMASHNPAFFVPSGKGPPHGSERPYGCPESE